METKRSNIWEESIASFKLIYKRASWEQRGMITYIYTEVDFA